MVKKKELNERATVITEYLEQIEPQPGETARSHRFSMLMKDLFGLEPGFIEDYVSGLDKYIRTRKKDTILRGEPDNLFGNLIVEFEHAIPKNLGLAKEQLERYTAICWTNEDPVDRRPYICIATDGVRFQVFSPSIADETQLHIEPQDVRLEKIEECDWAVLNPDDIYLWLDRYFMRKHRIDPTSENIVSDFGLCSHAFLSISKDLMTVWMELKSADVFSVAFENWEKYLKIVYGSAIGSDDLFIRHTYLATLAKLMAWIRLNKGNIQTDDRTIQSLLEGRVFKEQGIENFIEEDFFSWIARPQALNIGRTTIKRLHGLFQNYDLSKLSEDVLKSLYQELVDPATRHDLGEFYTPDWLAHKLINYFMDINPEGNVLDPSCGSGTFLYLAIREKRKRLGDSKETLSKILDTTCGIDVHPLAVIIAKTNFILALGELLSKRGKKRISIPIHLADALKPPEAKFTSRENSGQTGLGFPAGYFTINIDDREINIPSQVLRDPGVYDQAIEVCRDFAVDYKDEATITKTTFERFIGNAYPEAINNDSLITDLYRIASIMRELIRNNRDSIWAYILKNFYKPLFLKNKFDFIIGNPPWLSFRFMDPSYQRFVRHQMVNEYRLHKSSGHLATHMDIATLFFARTADIYLKTDGLIGFVLPRSVFSGDEHDRLRKGEFVLVNNPGHELKLRSIWDCDKVEPLFNVPSCVIIAEKKRREETKYPVDGIELSGSLERKNSNLAEANEILKINDVKYWLHKHGKRSYWGTSKQKSSMQGSYYKDKFYQGASIVPRSFWYVDIIETHLGINTTKPRLQTSQSAKKIAKGPYKSIDFRGTVESDFLYATLTSSSLVPFCCLAFQVVVLPIIPKLDHYEIIDSSKAKNEGFSGLAEWLRNAEKIWKDIRGAKASDASLIEWLNYNNKLTRQNPNAKYRVIYNTSGTYLCANVVKQTALQFKVGNQEIPAAGFVADTKTYYMETSNRMEGLFLATLLNSPSLDKILKPMQSRGAWGPRDIHKKILELPIPKFEPDNKTHKIIASMGDVCSRKVTFWLSEKDQAEVKPVGRIRAKIRNLIHDELLEIDKLTKKLIKI